MRSFSLVYSAEGCRRIDERAIRELGIPGIQLMHRAGRGAFEQLCQHWPRARSLTIFTGSGSNAGDGFVVAGLARMQGWEVQIKPASSLDRIRGDAKKALDWMQEHGIHADGSADIRGDVIVDALLGTGASGTVRPAIQQAIDQIRNASRPVFALDLPSGLDPSTGALLTERPVLADMTATFVGVKLGLLTGSGPDCAGIVDLHELDLPATAYQGIDATSVLPSKPEEAAMPRRSPAFHKNRFGHVLVIAGGAGMGGAAALASMATLRTGAGLVSVATHENHVSSVLALAPEAMVHGIVEPTRQMQRLLERATCVVAGPGLGSSTWAGDMIRLSLECGKPLVLDADGLNLIARNGWSVPQHSLLTPHPGEAARLLNTSLKSVDADRPRAAAELSARHTSTVVLKGAGTLVADSGRLHGVCPVACPALATAGSGDVLAGIAGAALAQGLAPASAASLGVWLHAQAGLLCHRSSEGRAVIARDIIDGIRPWERPA